MALTDSQLTAEALVIKNETATGANTATRVGTMLTDLIDNKINNDKISTSIYLGSSDALVPSQNAVKAYADNNKISKSINVETIDGTGIADNQLAVYDLTNKKIKTSGKIISTDGTFNDNSDSLVPTQKAVKTYISNSAPTLPYKSYMALLSDNDKVLGVTILYNTLSINVTAVTVSATGTFLLTTTGSFAGAMIIMPNSRESNTSTNISIVCNKSTDNSTIQINTFLAGALANGILNKTPIEIRMFS
jgi:hypothetical protein